MDWVGGWKAIIGKRSDKVLDLRVDMRVLRSGSTDENWECHTGRASQEENGTVSFI